ncbi:MAG: hypothetical protein JXB88_04430 [Spirochaetales bacterium]|nr:hypothetical protein [Spirochaetales bacterium]
MTKWLISLFVILSLAGCSTFTVKQKTESVYKIIDLINKGDSKQLITLSNIPFMYDSEIILLQKDMHLLWDSLSGSGFSIRDPVIEWIDTIYSQSYALFTSSLEGQYFFKRYLPKKAIITKVSSKEGVYYFLTGGEAKSSMTIFGMKGPVQ